jgi:geranylgeranyl pyrophosphate synthase
MPSTIPEFEDTALRLARGCIGAHAENPAQERLLVAALEGSLARHRGIGPEGYRRAVRLPLAVSEAVCGDARRGLPVAATMLLIRAGMDTLDDLMDGDPRPWWGEFRTAEVLLAGSTLVAALPPLAIFDFGAPPARIARMLRALAEAGMILSAGQQGDLTAAGRRGLTVLDVEACAARKSGEVHALGARLAAELAGAPAGAAVRFARLGRELGIASQFASDCYDLFVAEESRDLLHGTRTLPLILHAQTLAASTCDEWWALLDRACTDAEARAAVRRRLQESGDLRLSAVVVEIHCRRAYDVLAQCGAAAEPAAALRRLIRDCSLLPE